MVHVSIQHIIGTVALISLALSIALAYQIVVGSIEEGVIRAQLSQVAEYTSMSISNIVGLVEFTYGIISTGEPVLKRLSLPETINGRPYNISIVSRNGTFYVYVSIIGKNHLYSESPIAAKSMQRMVVFTGEEYLSTLLGGFGVEARTWICGGGSSKVIWCLKFDDVIHIGLGLLVGG